MIHGNSRKSIREATQAKASSTLSDSETVHGESGVLSIKSMTASPETILKDKTVFMQEYHDNKLVLACITCLCSITEAGNGRVGILQKKLKYLDERARGRKWVTP
jgi:hypothetical protein